MRRLGKIIATALAFGILGCAFGVDAKKIVDEKKLNDDIEASLLTSMIVRTKRGARGKKVVSEPRKKAVAAECNRRIRLLSAILVRGGVEKSEVMAVVGNYVGSARVEDDSSEAAALRASGSPADLRYNIERLIEIYENIRGRYSPNLAPAETPKGKHQSKHHLGKCPCRRGEYRRGGH
ncbi:MAG: hypothetical protein Q4D57_01660 [Clostridia bacterium]|nr:hypothetical protein [Clostridia bacterium]